MKRTFYREGHFYFPCCGGTSSSSSSVAEEETFGEGSITNYSAHGLDVNTDISGKTALEALEMILFAEFYPVWSDATCSFVSGKGTRTLSVGDVMPALTTFESSGVSARTTNPSANGGALDTANSGMKITAGSLAVGDTATKRQTVTVTATRTYLAGTDVVKTSKGNPTNKTAKTANSKTGTVNSGIDATTYTIKTSSKTATANVYFAYPIWINGTLQSLDYSKALYGSSDNADDTDPSTYSGAISFSTNGNNAFKFELPATYTNVKVSVWDTLQHKWFTYSPTDSSSETKTIGSTKKEVAYTAYEFWDSNAGARYFKITFTIAD